MGNGQRVHIDDGEYSVRTVQKSTFPGRRFCLLLDLEDKDGLTPFLTNKEVEKDCERVRIMDMEIEHFE